MSFNSPSEEVNSVYVHARYKRLSALVLQSKLKANDYSFYRKRVYVADFAEKEER